MPRDQRPTALPQSTSSLLLHNQQSTMPTRGFRNVSEEHVYDPAHQEEALSQSQHTSHLEDSRASFQDNPYEHTFKMEPGQLTNGIQSSRQLTHRRNSGMSFVHEEHFGDRRYIGSRGEH